jgi:hypothetical protein
VAVLTQHRLLAYYPYLDPVTDRVDILAVGLDHTSAVGLAHTSAIASVAALAVGLAVGLAHTFAVEHIHSALTSRLELLVEHTEEQN